MPSYHRSEIKPVPQNHLRNQAVGGTCQAHAEAKVDLPLWCDTQVNRGEDLVLLLRDRIEPSDRADGTVVFEPSRNLRSQIVAEFEVWRKDNALVHALAVKRPVERRVQRPIPSADFLVHDGTTFPRPGVHGVLPPLVANFV